MDVTLTDDQRNLKLFVGEFLAKECPPAYVRAMEEDERGFTAEFWRRLVEVGWLGSSLQWLGCQIGEEPAAPGGLLELGLVVEEMGYAAMPGPFFSTVVLAAPLLQALASEEQRGSLLPRIARGEVFATVAFVEEAGAIEASSLTTVAKRQGASFVVSGTKLFVYDAGVAEAILCLARLLDGDDDDRPALFLVPADTPDVALTSLLTTGRDKQFEVRLDEVVLSEDALIGEPGHTADTFSRVVETATALKCSEMVGVMQAVLDMTVDYAKQREAFGKPIADFQAVQHHLADMYIQTETSRLLAYQALWRLGEGLAGAREVSLAKARINGASGAVSRLAHQVYGGVGYYVEGPLEIYSRRVMAAQASFGDTDYHLDRVAKDLKGERPRHVG